MTLPSVLAMTGTSLSASPGGIGSHDAAFERVSAAVEAFGRGEIVVVTDDDDRENEGDLFVAAQHCTPEKMAFIIRHTSGIVCAPLSADEARRLHLDPMVATNDAPLRTAFTVSVDVRHGLRTGISAEERAATVRALANGNVGASDFVRPGHVFPLVAREGGVLVRSGHTEACIDLCRLANLAPVGVLCELVNDDGTVKRGPQVESFAAEHGLRAVSVADLIAYRQARERLVERVASCPVDTEVGRMTGYAYTTPFEPVQHLALVHGEVADGRVVPARLHRSNVIEDVFGGAPLIGRTLRRFKETGCGVLVYLRDGTTGVPANVIGARDEQTGSESSREHVWREIGLGAQILRDVGVRRIRLLGSTHHSFIGLGGFGIEIQEIEPLGGEHA
jgi:3,4-dihydroxy 2-butanone 4-phosphate synthase/GTP cyclohydrolase II